MEIRFKSSVCYRGELVKNFNKNFETSFLLEEQYSEFKDGVSSIINGIHLNKAYVLFQNYKNENLENCSLQVLQNQPVFLLQFVIDGAFSFSLNEKTNTEFSLNKNMYNLFYFPASKYLYSYHEHEQCVLNIYFTESFLDSKMGFCFLSGIKAYLLAKKENKHCALFNGGLVLNAGIRNVVNEFLNCSFDGTTRKSYLESKLTELVLISLTSKDSKITTNKLKDEEKETLIKIENYIQNHLKEDLSIEKLSTLACYNTSKFKSVFKQVYGMPVFKYITSLRIEKATELISKHNYTIAQASYEVGYKNPQHFTVAFKKKLGYLPSQLIN